MTDAPDHDPTASTGSTVELGFSQLPRVLYDLAAVLPRFTGESLESQLQTFDIFAGLGSPTARIAIAALLRDAASGMNDPVARGRVETAAAAIAAGGRATAPPGHATAMEAHRAAHRRIISRPGHHVEEAEFRAVIARTGATLDPGSPGPDEAGRTEYWVAPDGRLVGWVYRIRRQDGDETGYCVSEEFRH